MEQNKSKSRKAKFIVFASQSGSNFQSIVQACKKGELRAEVLLMLTNNSKAGVLSRAQKEGVSAKLISSKQYTSRTEWDRELTSLVKAYKPDLIILAGFMCKLGPQFIKKFSGKIINSHPSLLPKYGGQGMYGHFVHKEVIKNKEQKTGISIHYVDEEYDRGPIIAQTSISVLEEDTAESLEIRLKDRENIFYIETLKKLLDSKNFI